MLDWYRGADAGDLKKSALNELVENLTCLNALKGKIWKSNQKVVTEEKRWKIWKSDQKIVMNGKLVKNSVMNEEMVQNGVMDLSIYIKLVGGTVCNPSIKICWRND